MPLYSNVNYGVPEPLDLANYEPRVGEIMSAEFDQAMALNPMQILKRNQKLAGWEDGLDLSDAQTELDMTDRAAELAANMGRDALAVEEQERQFREAGLEKQLKANASYNQEAINTIIENKQLENALGYLHEKSGVGGTIAGFGSGLAASFLDPIMVASAFVPVPGAARLLSLAAKTPQAGARAAYRAASGALSGAGGAAMLEPMIYFGQQQVQADYDFTNSLLNASFGAIMGAGMHIAGGAFADWRRARKGAPQPWEYVPPDDDSRALMQTHATDLERQLLEANPDIDPGIAKQAAHDTAATFDATARNWAYHEKKTVGEYYAANRPEYRSWQEFEPEGWRDLLPEEWRNRSSNVGDELVDVGWIGRQYEGLQGLNADAMTLAQFLEQMGEWEKRFPDMADFGGIRTKIKELQEKGWNVEDVAKYALDQTAYHGSPHRFKKFSLRRIGSGEGAQVHGWGLYFAQSRDVANEYRVRLGGSGYTFKGKPLYELYEQLENSGEYERLGVLDEFMTAHDIEKMDFSHHDSKAVEWFKKEIHPKLKGEGKFYEVDIPENTVLMDEQKTLSEQPEGVKAALENAADSSMPDDEQWANMAEYLSDALQDENITGRDLYNALALLGTKNYDQTLTITQKGAKKASEFLDHFGIKGITYVGRDDGRCFVIFDDKAVKITDTLYQAGTTELQDGRPLSERFADLPFVEADSANFFGDGKPVNISFENRSPENDKKIRNIIRQWAKENFSEDRPVHNLNTGWDIILTHNGVKSTFNHGLDENLIRSIPFIPQIIESGIYLGKHNKHSKAESHIFANKIRLDGKEYVVGFVIREDGNGKRFYDHELTEIINPDLLQPSRMDSVESPGHRARANRGVVMNILREKLGVNDGTARILFQSDSHAIGRKTQILGEKFRETARYEVRELANVIPSHDPNNQFRKRPDYPAKAQERPYHSDAGEQQKVIGNALEYDPAFVISTDATATGGAPVITMDGIVLGGNSRAMTLGLVYAKHPEKAAAYRLALMDGAPQFGIDPNAIAGMKHPMLVRVVSGKLTPEEMAKRSRQYNQGITQSLQSEAEGISRARFIGRKSLDDLWAGIADGSTISEFLSGSKSADFAKSLLDDGVLTQGEISSLTSKNGRLNEAGKARVIHILRGLVLPDYELLTNLPKSAFRNLDAAIPAIALSRMRGDGWDLTGAFYEAMRFVARANIEGAPVENQFLQHSMLGVDPMRENLVVQVLAMTFANADVKEVRLRLAAYLEQADLENAGQSFLVSGMGVKPGEAFRKAFLETLAFVGDERLPNFNPDANIRDAAILWAYKNSGKKPNIERALKAIEKKLNSKKTSPEEKALLQDYNKELSAMSGQLGVREPKTGSFWKGASELEIPAPKQPGEKGSLPEFVRPDEVDMNDPDALQPPELSENQERKPNNASVTFDAETGRAVVTFFRSANLSSAPHELFHIYRREMERTALSPDGSAHAKEQWRKVNEFVGAKEGQPWTKEMEEKFARAGERYLAEGRAPTPGLRGIFERLKQWFMDIYQKAENIGVEISPQMREVFDKMFTAPYDVADRNFRYAVGELNTRSLELADPASITPEDQALLDAEKNGNLPVVEELTDGSKLEADEALARLEQQNPEATSEIIKDANAEIEMVDKELEHVEVRDDFRRNAMECVMNGG